MRITVFGASGSVGREVARRLPGGVRCGLDRPEPARVAAAGERTGEYRLGTDELLFDADGDSRISTADFAVALLDEADNPRHRRRRFTVVSRI